MKYTNQKSVKLTMAQALVKLQQWCAYQERSQQEVRDKLYEFGLSPLEVEEAIAALIEDNFLSEERFAMAYVSGKFKIKHWGKLKIKQGLKQKQISERLLQKALASIDMDDYVAILHKIAEKKSLVLTEKEPMKRKLKLVSYLQSKGFENDLIFDVLKDNNLP